MANIGTLAVSVVAQTEGFNKGMRKAQAIAGGFFTKVTIGAGVVSAGFAALFRMFDAAGSQLNDLSTATGISVQQLDFLKYAAEQSGASIENVTRAARELQSKGIDPNRFEELAAKIAAVQSPTQRAQMAFELFGKKAGAAILPMLNDLPALKKRFQELGGGVTSRLTKAADAMGDAFGDVKFAVRNAAIAIAIQLAPAVTQLSKFIADNVAGVRDWIMEHGNLVKAITLVAFTLATVIPVLYGITKAIKILKDGMIALQFVAAAISKNPVILALLAVAALGAYAVSKISSGPKVPPPAIPVQPKSPPPQAPAPNNGKLEKNTDTMTRLMAENNEYQRRAAALAAQKSQQPPVTLAVAGVR